MVLGSRGDNRATVCPLRDYLMVSAHRVVPLPLIAGTLLVPSIFRPTQGTIEVRTLPFSSPEEFYLRRYPDRSLSLGSLHAMVTTRVPKLIILDETVGNTSSGRDSVKATAAMSNMRRSLGIAESALPAASHSS